MKDQPVAPSPVQSSTAAPGSAHGNVCPLTKNTTYDDVLYVSRFSGRFPKLDLLHSGVSPAVHPHPHNAPPSALVPVMTTVAPQPGLPGNTHAFQVRSHCVLY